jgi:hypothetical protein
MTLFELMKSDEVFTKESNAILYRAGFKFLALYYGLSSVGIYTGMGRQAVDHLAKVLPGILKHQYDLLRGIDNSSHVPYLLTPAIILGVGAFYVRSQTMAVRAFGQRNLQRHDNCDMPYRFFITAILASFLMLLMFVFAGSMAIPSGGGRIRPWLIWPISGIFMVGALVLFLMGMNMYLVGRKFGFRRREWNFRPWG